MRKSCIILLIFFVFIILGSCSTTNNKSENTEIMPTIVGYSFYDEYGNYLDDGIAIHTFEVQKHNGKLSQLKFSNTTFHEHFDKTIQVNYNNDKIIQIIIEKSYSYMQTNYINSTDRLTNDKYYIRSTHNLEKTTITYEYNQDSFKQSQTIDYILEENQRRQVIISETEVDIFTKETVDGKSKVIYSEEIRLVSLGDDVTNLIQNKDLLFYKNSNLVLEDLNDFMTDFNNNKYYNFATESYLDINNNFNYNYNNAVMYIKSELNDISEIKQLDHNTDFSDSPIERSITKYQGKFKVYENFNNYYWFPSTFQTFIYKPSYKAGLIDHIDQYDNDKLILRYVFKNENYGYQVTHYSYVNHLEIKKNLFNGESRYFPSTPMYIIRNNNLYTNALLKQTIPYEYLLSN